MNSERGKKFLKKHGTFKLPPVPDDPLTLDLALWEELLWVRLCHHAKRMYGNNNKLPFDFMDLAHETFEKNKDVQEAFERKHLRRLDNLLIFALGRTFDRMSDRRASRENKFKKPNLIYMSLPDLDTIWGAGLGHDQEVMRQRNLDDSLIRVRGIVDTDKQRLILEARRKGWSNKEIAEKLGYSIRMVEIYIKEMDETIGYEASKEHEHRQSNLGSYQHSDVGVLGCSPSRAHREDDDDDMDAIVSKILGY